MAIAEERGLVPFIHTIDGAPNEAFRRAQKVACSVSDTTVVVFDALIGSEHSWQACMVGPDTPNLVFDIRLARLYMSVDNLLASPLPKAEMEAILAGNISQILDV